MNTLERPCSKDITRIVFLVDIELSLHVLGVGIAAVATGGENRLRRLG